jgi:hypothetical protein
MSANLEDLRRAHERALRDWIDAAVAANGKHNLEIETRMALIEAEEAAQTSADMDKVLTLREIAKVLGSADIYWAVRKVHEIVKSRLREIEAVRTDHSPDVGQMGISGVNTECAKCRVVIPAVESYYRATWGNLCHACARSLQLLMRRHPIPQALFSCSNTFCAQEVSYYADQLYWFSAEGRWVCENCWEQLEGEPPRGVRLDRYIAETGVSAAELVTAKPN